MAVSSLCPALAAAILLGLAQTVTSQPMTSCSPNPEIRKSELMKCFSELGFTRDQSNSVFSLNIEVLCRMQGEFIQAIKCQIDQLTRCWPEKVMTAPSLEANGLPGYISALCSTKGLNSTCYDQRKPDVNVCTRQLIDRMSSHVTSQEGLCVVMQELAATCARNILQDCGDVTVDVVVKHISLTRPARCLVSSA
ncbi:uncharacterized protein LOC131929892 [Physella acuta]|uniref:uncharacterized protein LOC131929892 n=1 Tax=Physella acuta TaxID=109671 RepID=UPI0027DDC5B5|nr:uncharacterized protein LOC131929892 [Physella acuta]